MSNRGCSLELRPKTELTVERRAELRLPGEFDLYRDKRSAEEESLAKSEFLSTLCHEIRNPVNVMIGMLDLALQTNLTQEQREYLTLMKISSGSVLKVINHTLDIKKIEAGCFDLEAIPFSLRASLGEVVKMLSFEARRKGLSLAWEVAPDVPDSLRGDPMRLRQIILNLLSNAIKFTEQGEVVMQVTCPDLSGGVATCQFAIRDTGPGIPLEKQAVIFSPFVQADASVSRQHGGSGLGLSISARLVKLMDGQIWLESQPGMGSTFFFTARFDLSDGQSKALQVMPVCGTSYPISGNQLVGRPVGWSASSLRILLVDDDSLNRRLAQLVLENEGCYVAMASSAEAALEALQHEQFDVVLMDLKMPGMDGGQATREIRRGENGTGEHLLVFALTANETAHDEAYCRQSGMDGCLKKPIQPGSLFAMIRQLQAQPGDKQLPQVLNVGALMDSVNQEEKLLTEIIDLFLENCDKLMARALESLAMPDQSEFERIMHTMKGMFQCLFAGAAERVAGSLQNFLAEDERETMFSQLELEVRALKAALLNLKSDAVARQRVRKVHARYSALADHRKKSASMRSSGDYWNA